MKNVSQSICPGSMLACSFTENLTHGADVMTVNITDGFARNITRNATFQNESNFPQVLTQPSIMLDDGRLGERIETASIIVYSLIIIIAFFGNGLLVLTMTLTEKMRTTTNYFLLNMAVGDLLVAFICAPFQLATWKFPSIKTFDNRICKSVPFIQLSTVGISIYTMVAVAFLRYRAVLNPLHSHYSKRSVLVIIIIVWVATFVTALPVSIVHDVKTVKIGNETIKMCGEFHWPDPKNDAAIYTYVLFSVEYAAPGLITGFLYLRIIIYLWYRDIPGMQNMTKLARQKFRNKHYRRKKTVIMLLAIFLTFMICNLPMHVISFIYYVQGSRFKAPSYMPIITTCAEMALYANSAVNPILYGFLHTKFSASAKALLSWVFCRKKRPNYNRIINNKKEKQITLNSASSTSFHNKRDDDKNAETRL